MAYSGAPEFTASGDREPGHVLLIEIAGPTDPPSISKMRCGCLSKVAITRLIQTNEDLDAIREELAKIASPRTLLHLTLSGLIPIGQDSKLQEINNLTRDQFVWSKISQDALVPEGAPVDLPAYFPEVEARLRSLAESAMPQAPAARLALIRLYEGAAEAWQ
jgi:hypothetical protein